MKIVEKNGMIDVYTPYNAEFVMMIKQIGGARWNADEKCWTVPATEVETVRQYMMEVYGESDISCDDKVTVIVTFEEDAYADRAPIVLFGKTVASAWGRDSGARPGSDVTIIDGDIDSGGSMKYWRTEIDKGTVLKIRNVPRAMLSRDTRYSISVVVDETFIDTQALQDEKEKLLRRIAEIDAILSENDVH